MANTYKYVQDWIADEESTLELLTSNSPPSSTPVGCIGAVGGKELYMNSGTKWDLIAPGSGSVKTFKQAQIISNANQQAINPTTNAGTIINFGSSSGDSIVEFNTDKTQLNFVAEGVADFSMDVEVTTPRALEYDLRLYVGNDNYRIAHYGDNSLTSANDQYIIPLTVTGLAVTASTNVRCVLTLTAPDVSKVVITRTQLRIRTTRT